MKSFVSFIVLATCQLCFAGQADSASIAVSEWSEPIPLRNDYGHDEAIRGRLLILQGMEPPYGGPPETNAAMTFVELQNVTGSYGEGIDFCFAVTNLHCELSDSTGRAIPKPNRAAWSGRGAFPPYRVSLPYNSTIRLFVNCGSLKPLSVYPSGEPWSFWSILKGTNTYYLAGTLRLSTYTNSLSGEYSAATLAFPKARITSAGKVEAGRRR